MDTRTIVSVTETATGSGTPCWMVLYQDDGGAFHSHTFPHDTLHWRAAEYDIDPADIDTLLDIVLHEPHIPDPNNPLYRDADIAAKQGLMAASRGGGQVPMTLANAPTLADARTAHLARVAEAKERVQIKIPKVGKGDILAAVRASHQPDQARIARMRKDVETHRSRLRGERQTKKGTA